MSWPTFANTIGTGDLIAIFSVVATFWLSERGSKKGTREAEHEEHEERSRD